MTITAIWTCPAMTLRERINRTQEWGWRKAAHHLPRRLAYWSLIDSGARAIRGSEVVPEVTFFTVLERADGGRP